MIQETGFCLPATDPFARATVRLYAIQHLADSDSLEFVRSMRPLLAGEEALFDTIVPPWQRPFVWNQAQQIRFVESAWLEHDLGRYVVNDDDFGPLHGILVDGRQRLTSIRNYLAGCFPVFGAVWRDVPRRDQMRFRNRIFARVQVSYAHEAGLVALYERLAYGGTPHQAARTVPLLRALHALAERPEYANAKGAALQDLLPDLRAALREWENG
jgi:hypothetical protein